MTLVVDADVAIKWHVEQGDSSAAERVLASQATLHAPEFQYLEVRQVLWKYVRRRLLTKSDAEEAAGAHGGMIGYWHGHASLAQPAFELALEYNHPFYDCLYLALAVRLDARVVTADKAFVSRFSTGAHAGRVILLADFAANS